MTEHDHAHGAARAAEHPHAAPSGAARGALLALAAAALFGASAPLSKLLLPDAQPLALSALLYLGAGVGLSVWQALSRAARFGSRRPAPPAEAQLRRADAPVIAGMIALGGVLGPLLLLLGLQRVSGIAGSLLLNLEAPLTVLAAVALFSEHLGRAEALAAALLIAGAAALGLGPGELRADPAGIALLAGACAAWALDNNLGNRLALRDPAQVVRVKALGAGACTLCAALLARVPLPAPRVAALALGLGALSYGASLVLVLRAQRLLGAARQALWFATAPFIGALLSVPLLGERPGAATALAVLLMLAGVLLLRREKHAHRHAHAPLEHDHLHVHDEHHQHAHDESAAPLAGPHAHAHRHEPLVHEHPHTPDAHHRHGHH